MGSASTNSWYRVTWPEYSNNVRDLLSDAWHLKFHTDLIIVADSKVIKCHRMVLARNIRFFRDLLSQDFVDDKPVIVALLAPFELVNAIIRFIYLGVVEVTTNNLNPLMKLANELGVNGMVDNSEMNSQQTSFSQAPSSVLVAAEALSNLGKAPRVADNVGCQLQQGVPIDYHVVPKQLDTIEASNQPSAGEQPPTAQQDQVDFLSLRYKAAASRKSASRSPPPCSPSTGIKRRRLSHTTSLTSSSASPEHRNPSPSTSGSSYQLAKQEEPDSEDSDGELQIDEGIDQPSPIEYLDEQMYVEEDEPEPQDLRVEARQQLLPENSEVTVQSVPSSASPMFISSSSGAVFRSTNSSNLFHNPTASTDSHFLSAALGEVTVHTVPKKRPNGIALSVLNTSANGSGNFVTLTHHLKNGHSRKNSITTTSTSSKDGGLVQVNINNNETIGTSNNNNNGSSSGKMMGAGKSNEKSYTYEQLMAAVEAVIRGEIQPVEAINQYGIPRRTFFRHLKNRRRELGIETKTRSKPSSRATSPHSQSPSSNSEGSGPATPKMANNFHLHHQIPASGTELHAMLKSFSSTRQNTAPEQATNNNIVKQEPEDTTSNNEDESSALEEKDKVFALLKQSVAMNLKQAARSKTSERR